MTHGNTKVYRLYRGRLMTVREMANYSGLAFHSVRKLVYKHRDAHDMTEIIDRLLRWRDERAQIAEAGVDRQFVRRRMRRGFTLEEALYVPKYVR